MTDSEQVLTNIAHKKIGTILMKNDRLMEILEGYHIVRLDKDADFNEKLTWCMEHCNQKFRDIKENDCRAWYFQSEQDATMFALKWSE